MSYASAVAEILAVSPRRDHRKELIRRSDALLHQLEQLNIDAYLPARPEQPVRGGRRIVRLPANLAQAVNGLLAEVGDAGAPTVDHSRGTGGRLVRSAAHPRPA